MSEGLLKGGRWLRACLGVCFLPPTLLWVFDCGGDGLRIGALVARLYN